MSENEHAKFGELVSDIISLLDDVPNKMACSTAVGQTGSEQGVGNLAVWCGQSRWRAWPES